MEENKGSLNVREIVLKSYRSVWVHRWDLVRISWMWVVFGAIIVAFYSYSEVITNILFRGGRNLSPVFLLFLIALMCAYIVASIASAWHQVLRKDGQVFVPHKLGFHAHSLNYIGPMLVLGFVVMGSEFLDVEGKGRFGVLVIFIVAFIASILKPLRLPLMVFMMLVLFYVMSLLPILFASPVLLSEYSNGFLSTEQVTFLGKFYSVFAKVVSYIWPLWLFSMVGLILPARAFGDKKYSFLQAKTLAYGHKKQLFMAMLLAELPIYVFAFALDYWDIDIWWAIGFSVFILILMSFVSLSVLTYSYQALVLDKNVLDKNVQKT